MFNQIKKLFFLLLFTCYILSLLNAQIVHYSMDDGLSQGSILSSLQDSNGYLWFGTADGLNCFNGYEFTIYRANPDDPNSLIDNEVRALVEDEMGNIWIGTALGLCRFSTATQKFTKFQYQALDSTSLSNNYVNFLFKDIDQQIWVGTRHGLNLYNFSTNDFTRFYQSGIGDMSSLEQQEVNTICQDENNNLWIGFEYGLCILKKNILSPVNEVYDIKGLNKDQKITSTLSDSDGNIWVGLEEYSFFSSESRRNYMGRYYWWCIIDQ